MGHCKFIYPKKCDIENLYVPKNGTFKIYMSQKMGHC